jgi:hypothetical protein
MAQEVRHVNLSDLREVPAWEHLVEEVRSTKKPAIIRADGEDIAELRPPTKRRVRIPRGKPTTADDPLWRIIGIAKGEEATDVSENHDKYLADAYADTHEA